MVTISDTASVKIVELIEKSPNPVKGLRIAGTAVSPLKVDFRMAFIGEAEETGTDQAIEFDGFTVFVDTDSATLVEQASVDYVEGLMGAGFKIERPRALPDGLDGSIVERVQQVIDEKINPGVAGHGGRISLIDIKDHTVFVQLEGGCQGCGMADVTLKQGIEVMIKEAVPEIEEVLDVTEHANGRNPYYQAPA